MVSLFSMASMTDVIFLLLIFFMVTSTFVFPTALEITLPQSSEQTAIKPTTRVFIDAEGAIYLSLEEREPSKVDLATLAGLLLAESQTMPDQSIAVYADETVTYGQLVEVLDLGARNNLKMVLATKPAPVSMTEAAADTPQQSAQ